jgi:hypothetical protein
MQLLTIKLVEAVSKITSIDKRRIWMSIDERPASQMAEYGHILPDPGKEAEWLATLPPLSGRRARPRAKQSPYCVELSDRRRVV